MPEENEIEVLLESEEIKEYGKSHNALDLARAVRTMREWEKYKQVYKFDKDWLEFVKQMIKADDEVDLSVLTKAPYKSYYVDNEVEFKGEKYDGFFVELTKSQIIEYNIFQNPVGKFYTSVLITLIKDTEKYETFYFYVPLVDGRIKISDVLEWAFKKYGKVEKEKVLEFISVAMYMCANNKDVEYRAGCISKKDEYDNKQYAKKGVSRQIVGYRLGNAIRQNRVVYLNENVEHKNGSKKAPHIRAGHIHHYWKGKSGEKELIVHYIEPIFVGNKKPKVATIHEVRK